MWDVIVIGLGAMGSAAAYHLALRGQRVIGFDRFSPPHTQGSSHGQTRIIREAYFEDPSYVPLLQRAYELWDALEKTAGEPLLLPTGGLMLGPSNGIVFPGARLSAETHRLTHEILSAAEVRKRFPAIQPSDEMQAVWEPRAGILYPERCIAHHWKAASVHGAHLVADEPILSWSPTTQGVEVTTTKGRYAAAQLLVTAGAWLPSLMPELADAFQVERQVLCWFEPVAQPDAFTPKRCPIHLWESSSGHFFYGFPNLGDGVKLAKHHDGELTSPDRIDRNIRAEDISEVRACAERYLPNANGELKSATVCLYTNTQDSHFWLDRHPTCSSVYIGSPCSGHGFKFASVMGEVLAQELCGGSPFDLKLFRSRLKRGAGENQAGASVEG